MKKTAIFLLLLIVILIGVSFVMSKTAPLPMGQNIDMLKNADGEDIISEEVNYYGNAKGYYAKPETEGNYPGIVMIHEWWGLNLEIKAMADELASEGYRVLAVDLYNGKIAATSSEARSLSSGINKAEALLNMKEAAEYLRKEGATKIASLGWCFGGARSLELSLSDEKLDATIIYYGQLVTDEKQLAAVDEPVLGIFGEIDTSIPTTTVRMFETALNNLNKTNDIYIYPGVGHAFANPSGMNYSPMATKDAWDRTLAFLDAHLR